jgi:hypothetical protein
LELSDLENRRQLGLIDCRLSWDLTLSVFSGPASPATLASEKRGFLLFMQPREEFLKPSVGQYSLHSVERVAKLIVTPGLVDEILTRMTRWCNFDSAFAPRYHVVSSRRDLTFTEGARLGHTMFVGA